MGTLVGKGSTGVFFFKISISMVLMVFPAIVLTYPFFLLSPEFYVCCVRLTKCCSRVIFSFCGDLLSTPHFPLLCCRPDSNTERPDPACTTVWTKEILSKRKGIYILKGYSSFPPRRQGNA